MRKYYLEMFVIMIIIKIIIKAFGVKIKLLKTIRSNSCNFSDIYGN